ncbi:hypothetical protein Mapa_012168 [Marchantia paleacea]|nr:hypothetical protein Mapa_012168 [Marchantia paleacea]
MGTTVLEGHKIMLLRGWSLTCFALYLCASTAIAAHEVHIVYMGNHHSHLPKEEIADHHHRILAGALGSAEAVKESILYSYKDLFSGFAARMSPEQIDILSNAEGVMSVFPNTVENTQTTHSWSFLGLDTIPTSGKEFENLNLLNPMTNLWAKTNYGKEAIIGVIDTGVWPESQSFNDEGLEAIPSKFKGLCETGNSFPASSCNKKLIGARYYFKGYEASIGKINATAANETYSPRDAHGHGTHTASTAAGRFSANVSDSGWGSGTAKGGAPLARLAIYKACWPVTAGEFKGSATCSIADVLKAMDDATSDGVDIISLSLGGSKNVPFFKDGISVGSYHATQKGVSVVMAAGNSGPNLSTVSNLHPWTTTVAASTIDRDFRESVVLGNNKELFGFTRGSSLLPDSFFPLVFGGDVGLPNADKQNASLCVRGTLDPTKVKGKVVTCLRGIVVRIEKSLEVMSAGGAGIIVANTVSEQDLSTKDVIPLPGCNVDFTTEQTILSYINSTSNPTVKLGKLTVLGLKGAPAMTSFSSVGPNAVVPDILKPDITAPGDQILAAWTGNTIDLMDDFETIKGPREYKLNSGTSMATPHVAGVSALLKSLYPHWSPAAIKSAIMTTASVLDNDGQPIKDQLNNTATPFQLGGGLINPNAAADPGLIYDAASQDYILFLCSLKYNSTFLKIVTGTNFTCPSITPSASDLNLPSVTIADLKQKRTIKRTVTNVGPRLSVYKFESSGPNLVNVTVFPTELHFKHHNEKKTFYLTLEREASPTEEWSFGSFTWVDSINNHRVRSPITVGATLEK